MSSFARVIDKAANICGSQKALAERMETAAQHISNAKAGSRPFPKEKLAVLASIVQMDPGELWELQEIANLPRRNPFLHAASAVLSAFLCVVLSVGGNDARADAYGANSISGRTDALYIVDLLASRLWGMLAALGSSLARCLPMLRHA